MVFGADVWLYVDEWSEVAGVVAGYFENFGDYLFFEVAQPHRRGAPLLYFTSSAPDYAPAIPVPSTPVNNYFELGLWVTWEGKYLVNKGYSSTTIKSYPHYSVKLGRLGTFYLNYEVGLFNENTRLRHINTITPLFVLAPVSFLF
jgi:hypothetical protein